MSGFSGDKYQMGAWYDDLLKSATDPLKQTYVNLVGEDVAAVTDKIAQEAYQKELEKQKAALATTISKELANLTGSKPPTASTNPITSMLPAGVTQAVAKVPGGFYTLLGVGAAAVFLIMRRK
jgi:hypothetical protein